MSAQTPKYGLSYLTGTDALALIDEWTQVLAERVDLLFGETGDTSITPSAVDTATSLRVNYARSYAGTGGGNPPRVTAVVNEGRTMAQDFHTWVSGEDFTGFTLNIRATTTATRSVRWICRPRGA